MSLWAAATVPSSWIPAILLNVDTTLLSFCSISRLDASSCDNCPSKAFTLLSEPASLAYNKNKEIWKSEWNLITEVKLWYKTKPKLWCIYVKRKWGTSSNHELCRPLALEFVEWHPLGTPPNCASGPQVSSHAPWNPPSELAGPVPWRATVLHGELRETLSSTAPDASVPDSSPVRTPDIS